MAIFGRTDWADTVRGHLVRRRFDKAAALLQRQDRDDPLFWILSLRCVFAQRSGPEVAIHCLNGLRVRLPDGVRDLLRKELGADPEARALLWEFEADLGEAGMETAMSILADVARADALLDLCMRQVDGMGSATPRALARTLLFHASACGNQRRLVDALTLADGAAGADGAPDPSIVATASFLMRRQEGARAPMLPFEANWRLLRILARAERDDDVRGWIDFFARDFAREASKLAGRLPDRLTKRPEVFSALLCAAARARDFAQFRAILSPANGRGVNLERACVTLRKMKGPEPLFTAAAVEMARGRTDDALKDIQKMAGTTADRRLLEEAARLVTEAVPSAPAGALAGLATLVGAAAGDAVATMLHPLAEACRRPENRHAWLGSAALDVARKAAALVEPAAEEDRGVLLDFAVDGFGRAGATEEAGQALADHWTTRLDARPDPAAEPAAKDALDELARQYPERASVHRLRVAKRVAESDAGRLAWALSDALEKLGGSAAATDDDVARILDAAFAVFVTEPGGEPAAGAANLDRVAAGLRDALCRFPDPRRLARLALPAAVRNPGGLRVLTDYLETQRLQETPEAEIVQAFGALEETPRRRTEAPGDRILRALKSRDRGLQCLDSVMWALRNVPEQRLSGSERNLLRLEILVGVGESTRAAEIAHDVLAAGVAEAVLQRMEAILARGTEADPGSARQWFELGRIRARLPGDPSRPAVAFGRALEAARGALDEDLRAELESLRRAHRTQPAPALVLADVHLEAGRIGDAALLLRELLIDIPARQMPKDLAQDVVKRLERAQATPAGAADFEVNLQLGIALLRIDARGQDEKASRALAKAWEAEPARSDEVKDPLRECGRIRAVIHESLRFLLYRILESEQQFEELRGEIERWVAREEAATGKVIPHLDRMTRAAPKLIEPWYDLMRADVKCRCWADAADTVRRLVAEHPAERTAALNFLRQQVDGVKGGTAAADGVPLLYYAAADLHRGSADPGRSASAAEWLMRAFESFEAEQERALGALRDLAAGFERDEAPWKALHAALRKLQRHDEATANVEAFYAVDRVARRATAIEWQREIYRAAGTHSRVNLALGRLYVDGGRQIDSIEPLRQARLLDPSLLGDVIGELDRTLSIDPRSARVHFELGEAHTAAGSLEDAVRHHMASVRSDPGFADRVLVSEEKTCAAHPEFRKLHLSLGKIYAEFQRGDPRERHGRAVAHFEKGIAASVATAGADAQLEVEFRLHLGMSLEALGGPAERQRAYEEYRKAAGLRVIEREFHDRMRAHYESLLEAKLARIEAPPGGDETPAARRDRVLGSASLALRLGRAEQARDLIQATFRDPGDLGYAESQYLLGLAWMRLDRNHSAILCLRQAIAHSRNTSAVGRHGRYQLAECLARRGEFAEAIGLLEELESVDARFPNVGDRLNELRIIEQRVAKGVAPQVLLRLHLRSLPANAQNVEHRCLI